MERLSKSLRLPLAHRTLLLIADLLVLYGKYTTLEKDKFLGNLVAIEQVIKEEVQQHEHKSILLDSYFNLMERLIECKEYYPYLDEIYFVLKPCLHLLAQQNNFHNNILSVFSNFIRQSKQMKPEAEFILQQAQRIMGWNRGSMQRLFEVFNLIAIYTESINTNIVYKLFDICVGALSHITEDTIPNDLLQGCLIMQLLLYYHGQVLTPQMKQRLLSSVVQVLDTQHVVLEPELFAKYLLIILQLLNSDFGAVCAELQSMGKEADITELLYDSSRQYKEDLYDAKVFVISTPNLI